MYVYLHTYVPHVFYVGMYAHMCIHIHIAHMHIYIYVLIYLRFIYSCVDACTYK